MVSVSPREGKKSGPVVALLAALALGNVKGRVPQSHFMRALKRAYGLDLEGAIQVYNLYGQAVCGSPYSRREAIRTLRQLMKA